jgi:soluble epoxide hydrolase / lipid-phosphate phosphatase
MDASLYKDITTSRELKYRYFFAPATPSKPTVLLCHGFPSTSRDWRHIVPYFIDNGYGVLAPDMLGYGGTDKPTDPAAYVPSLLTKDVIDILDAENLDKVVAIGHDWCVFSIQVAEHTAY